MADNTILGSAHSSGVLLPIARQRGDGLFVGQPNHQQISKNANLALDINLCIGALWAPVYFFLLPGRDPQPGKSFLARMAEIDWIGNTLIAGAFVSGIMAIAFGGVVYSVSRSK